MFLSEDNFNCPKGQIMHKQLSLALTVLIPNVNIFENSMKPDVNPIENSVDPDQLASEEGSQLIRIRTVLQATCKLKLINPIRSTELN